MDDADFLTFFCFVSNLSWDLIFSMGSDVLEGDLFGVELIVRVSTVMVSCLEKKVEEEERLLRSGKDLRMQSLSMIIENK